ncbi:class I SAM-dependent methyltransferase [Mucilaginibacter sabulilitoris]|uniref:Class I SAM-dependent methyltransferase n=1 Tax=Mucilaginibacter sabulilitoris TaxID=1173583 RepID=A0ABZ0TVP5_9SPHI|nr:class I SAM-dependent methyltransferase [Mucilaginibacter sabulilitoris]WPU95869.1 class I SAM-dependent methyltransferase [Mucilaginibacter sabulilitoris]
MEREMIRDIVAWDIVNWSKAIKHWQNTVPVLNKGYECLELGSSKGGMSLWLALNGNKVLCTDLNGPEEAAYQIHEKYNCSSKITYGSMDATNIPHENKFDVVIFKSIIGGIPQDKAKTLTEIHKALKPGGKLLFAENLEATRLHKILRKNFGTKGWDYLRMDEINEVFAAYNKVTYTTAGFFGCMGRNEWQRNFLGNVDTMLNWIIPNRSKYILIGVAEK